MTNENLSLQVQAREATGKQVAKLREQGKIPAVLYGDKTESVNLQVEATIFEKIYAKAGDSTLVDLIIGEDKPIKVLIQDYQLDPLINSFLHVDFYKVNMKEKIHAEVPIKFINEAPAVKEFSGVLVTSLKSLSVECLPDALVHEIEVDLSALKTFDDSLHVSDVKAPEGIEFKNMVDDIVALVQAPRVIKDVTPVVAEGEAESSEGEAKEEDAEVKTEGEVKAEDKKEEKK